MTRNDLRCFFGEPWLGPHPLCDAEVERACAAFDESVERGEYDADGYTEADRRAQQRRHPSKAVVVDRCALCPGVNLCIPPDGPQERGGILFIGEAPGVNENKKNRVFIGKTGEEVNRHYLPLAGLRRDAVCFTNAIRCLPVSAGGKLDPKRAADTALLLSCTGHHLNPHISQVRPRLIVPLGQFACRAIFREAFDLELLHGIPQDTPLGIPAFPMYHPALGLHEPKKMLYIRTDWDRLRQYLKGMLRIAVDTYAGQEDYAEVTHEDEIAQLDPETPLAVDTESSREGPYCLTYSQSHGSGRLIRSGAVSLLQAFDRRMQSWQAPLLFHNWLYDWTVVEAMGLHLPHRRVVDTMAAVYRLGNLPQGLKALATRELGMVMQDFDDLVTPYSTEEVLRYYRLAYAEEWPKPDPQMVRDADGKWKVYKPQSMSTKLKRFFTDYQKSDGEKDVFNMWEKNWEASQVEMEERCGPWPGKDIRHVPFDQVLHYACRDADATFRLYPIIKRMSRVVRKLSQERWREVAA